MDQVKNVLLIQVLNSFVAGVIGVAVPLMMVQRGIDVVVIGFVFSAMPLIMQFGRMFFATFSDFWGRKLFFVSNGFLGIFSSLIYYVAHSPLEFLFGKVGEGTKEGTLWAVNRAFLLEKGGGHWRILVYLRTTAYVAYAFGCLAAGFLAVWLLFEGEMLLCAILGLFVVLLSLFVVSERKERFTFGRALQFLDFRKKSKAFKVFLVLFFCMGISFGFHGGFIFPLFLENSGFLPESIGLIIGVQILVAGVFSYVFAQSINVRKLTLLAGILYSLLFLVIGFSTFLAAGALVIAYGFVDGMASIGQEGVLSKISTKESYGTDIGLLMMGLHLGESLSLALSGVFISLWGFAVPFILAAGTYVFFYVGSYVILKE